MKKLTGCRLRTLISSRWFVMPSESSVRKCPLTPSYCLLQIGSVVLFGLYLIVKYYGKEWITWLLQWYFTIAGVGSVGKVRLSCIISRPSGHADTEARQTLISLARWTLGDARWKAFDNIQLMVLKGPRSAYVHLSRLPHSPTTGPRIAVCLTANPVPFPSSRRIYTLNLIYLRW